MPVSTKITLCGLQLDRADFTGLAIANRVPFDLGSGISIEYVGSFLTSDNFNLWQRDGMLSTAEAKTLSGWEYALANRFEGDEFRHVEGVDEDSRTRIFHAYLAAKIVRPQRYPFPFIQGTLQGIAEPTFEVKRFAHPESPLVLPDSEARSWLVASDFDRLCAIAARTHYALAGGLLPIVGAIRNMESGYSSRFPYIQQLAWCSGIEALLFPPPRVEPTKMHDRLGRVLGNDFDPYAHSLLEDFERPDLDYWSVVEDVFRARNLFVHGGWIPDEWLTKEGRHGTQKIPYADVLREVTSATLRGLLERILATNDNLNAFSSHDAIDSYFG